MPTPADADGADQALSLYSPAPPLIIWPGSSIGRSPDCRSDVDAGSNPVQVAKRFLRLKVRYLTSDQRLRVRVPQEAPHKGTHSKYYMLSAFQLALRVRVLPASPNGAVVKSVITLKHSSCLVLALLV